uniref:Uncharacterized protein n=1 Tax=Rhizophora mucronata TaxID=61149 RepID=A0A2P2L155_RHIMU
MTLKMFPKILFFLSKIKCHWNSNFSNDNSVCLLRHYIKWLSICYLYRHTKMEI